jgi:phage-related protein
LGKSEKESICVMDKFIFGNVDSEDFKAYIFAKEIDTVPQRDCKEVVIPGRHGTFIIDNGRYENVDHVYDVILKSDTAEEDYIRFRNELAVQVGYQRLSDTIAKGEYYEARLAEVTEPVTTRDRTGIKFEVVFDRKPNRYLTSGDVGVEMSSGDVIINPTPFESQPLLEVYGYGGISINLNDTDEAISINDRRIGKVRIGDSVTVRNFISAGSGEGASMVVDGPQIVNSKFKTNLLNAGDKVWFSSSTKAKIVLGIPYPQNWSATIGRSNVLPYTLSVVASKTYGLVAYLTYDDQKGETCSFSYGTEDTSTYTDVIALRITADNETYEYQFPIAIIYHGADTITTNMVLDDMSSSGAAFEYIKMPVISGNSSKRTLGDPADPFYIDLETGVAYKNEANTYVPINSAVWLGAKLPTLKPGENTVTFTGHVNKLTVTPRWWMI